MSSKQATSPRYIVVNRMGTQVGRYATRTAAVESTIALVSAVTGERFSIEGLPTTAGSMLSFKSLL